jgi:hypothetical protein
MHTYKAFVGGSKIHKDRDSWQPPAQSGHNQTLIFPYKITVDLSVQA